MKNNALIVAFMLLINLVFAQESPTVVNVKGNDKILEQLSAEYKSSLFSASGMDINETSKNWKHMLMAMEMHAEQIKFDLKGVQVWLKIYWDKTGKIDYINYFLLDKSKNVANEDMEAFLKSFIDSYELPISHKSKFAYDARVQFPIYMMR